MGRRPGPSAPGLCWALLGLVLAGSLTGCPEGDGASPTPTARDPQGNETPTSRATPAPTATPSPATETPAPPTAPVTPLPNLPPEATILAPADGASFEEGQGVSLVGEAVDPEDGPLTGPSLSWRSSRDGLLGNGSPLSVASLSLGAHVITLAALDANGGVGRDQIGLTIVEVGVDQPPLAHITSPAEGSVFGPDDAVPLAGEAVDPEDGPLTGESLAWASDLDGPLGVGSPLAAALRPGLHTLSLVATDSFGHTGRDAVSITVSAPHNDAPVVTLLSPDDGSRFTLGDAILLEGEASDPEDGPLTGDALQWTSDLAGPLGAGGSLSVDDLAVGAHRLTLTATDSEGLSAAASVGVTVLAPPENQAPVVKILAPVDGRTVPLGEAVTLRGEATDPEDGPLTGAALSWTSSLDGLLGLGGEVEAGSLSLGSHLITLTALDSEALAGRASIHVTVTEAGVENLPPIARLAGPIVVRQGEAALYDGGASSDPDGAVVRWAFDFGDGASTGGEDPEALHTFTGAGPWTVTLTVTDDDGLSDTAQLQVEQRAPALTQAVVADTRARLGSFCSLAYLPDGRAAVAYSDDSHGGLYLAVEGPPRAFTSQLVDGYALGEAGGVWPGMDLAADDEGRLHLAWIRQEVGGWGLRYGSYDGAEWAITDLGPTAPASGIRPLSLSLDGGAPVLLHRRAGGRVAEVLSCPGACDDPGVWAASEALAVGAGEVAPGAIEVGAGGAFATVATTSPFSFQILRREAGGGWASLGAVPGITAPASGPKASRLTLADAPLALVSEGVVAPEGEGWQLSPVEPQGLSYFDLRWAPDRRALYVLSRHDGVLELVESTALGFFLYDALTSEDAAWPELALSPAGDPHLCFARDGNVLIF